ncbi:hypothetical protein [Paenibacillus sp. NPDC058174]|uniref:hypothetical protein n=1 Tax=Paenibacillus sp. NPDC058174 TaxID=3346366 RepID=UPI0036D9339F
MSDTAKGHHKHGQLAHIDMLPLFSTTDKNEQMTSLLPGHRIGRVAPVLPWLFAATILWALTGSVPFGALLGLAPTPEISKLLGHPVTVGVAVVLFFVVIGVTGGVYSRGVEQFGQIRVAGLFATLAIAGGLFAGAGVLLLWTLTSNPSRPFDLEAIVTSPTIPPELGVVVGACFALLAAYMLLRLPVSIAHARRRQADIQRLRAEGSSFIGTLTAINFTNSWLLNYPMFKVEVSYISSGAPRVVSARMRTTADRVPVIGTSMLVLTDDHGTILVELDPSNEAAFEPDAGKYAAPDG